MYRKNFHSERRGAKPPPVWELGRERGLFSAPNCSTRPLTDCHCHLIALEGKTGCSFLFEEKQCQGTFVMQTELEIPLKMEPTLRQQKRKAALQVGLGYYDVNWLFLGLELGWVEGPLLGVPARNGRERRPLGTEKARPVLSSSLLRALFPSLEAANVTIFCRFHELTTLRLT